MSAAAGFVLERERLHLGEIVFATDREQHAA
jgi:hypothetical protein